MEMSAGVIQMTLQWICFSAMCVNPLYCWGIALLTWPQIYTVHHILPRVPEIRRPDIRGGPAAVLPEGTRPERELAHVRHPRVVCGGSLVRSIHLHPFSSLTLLAHQYLRRMRYRVPPALRP